MRNQRNEAQDYVRQQDWSSALPLLLELLDSGENDIELHHLTGFCYKYMGQLDLAINAFKRAVVLAAELPDSEFKAQQYNALGVSYQNNEAYEKAIQTLLEGIKIFSDIFSMHNSLGITYKLNAEPDKALIAFLDARDIALSNAFESCDVKNIDGEKLSAADNEKISLKLRSTSDWCTVMSNIGMNLLRAGNIDHAENALKESVDFIPSGFDYPGPQHALDYIYSIRKED